MRDRIEHAGFFIGLTIGIAMGFGVVVVLLMRIAPAFKVVKV